MIETEASALRSVFVPAFANQGQEMSCHVLWAGTATLGSLTIRLPEGLKLLHVYNVPETSLEVAEEDRTGRIRAVSENGYVGFVVKSAWLDSPDEKLTVEFEIDLRVEGHDEHKTQSRQVRLVRPDVRLAKSSPLTRVRFPSKAASPEVSGQLELRNQGEGTAFVAVTPSATSKVEFIDFFDVSEKTEQLIGFLKERFETLAEEFPIHATLLKSWTNYVEKLHEKKYEAAFKLVPGLQAALRLAERADPLFVEDLGSVFEDAFRVTFTADERFTGWIRGFDSMRDQRVVLFNPWSSIPLSKGRTSLMVDIRSYDQLGNEQTVLESLPVTIDSDAEGLLPMFELVSVGPLEQGEAP